MASKVTEQQLEKKLVDFVKSKGGIALKGATQFDTGYPDRIIYLPDAHAHVELKGTSNRYHLNEKQKLWAGRIIASGSPYYIVENIEQLEKLCQDITSPLPRPAHSPGVYPLNGFNLFLSFYPGGKTYAVLRCINDHLDVLFKGETEEDTLTNIIYRVFKRLESEYPNKNYADI